MPESPVDPAEPHPRWVPDPEITWQEMRTLKRVGVNVELPEIKEAIIKLVSEHERAALVHLLRSFADDVYTYENPPQGSWWRRTLWYMDQSGIRDNYAFQGRLRRLARTIEREMS